MIDIHESIIRCGLKPRVACDLPGRLRMLFPRHALLPDAAKPYLHDVEEILKLLPGVHTVRVNLRIGTVLVLYDPSLCSARHILRWIDMIVDTGMEIAHEMNRNEIKDARDIASFVRQKLWMRLPQRLETEAVNQRRF